MTQQTTVLTEGRHDGGFLISEAPGTGSRASSTIANSSGAAVTYPAGLVLARKPVTPATTAAGTNTGNGTMGTVTASAGAMPGAYTLKIITAAANAGQFEVIDPQGDLVGIGNVAVAFSTGGLAFTLADGSADFVVGDTFTITVPEFTGHIPWTASTGPADAILFGGKTIADGATKAVAVVCRNAEVNAAELMWDSSVTTDAVKLRAFQRLADRGIVVR